MSENEAIQMRAFYAGWHAGFQEALTPDAFPDQDRAEVAWHEYVAEFMAGVEREPSEGE